jgi:hypothetical protein
MGWMTGEIGVQFMAGTEISSLLCPDQLRDPPRLLSNGCSFPAVKWPGSEADYLTSSRLRLRMNGAVPLLPHMSLGCND